MSLSVFLLAILDGADAVGVFGFLLVHLLIVVVDHYLLLALKMVFHLRVSLLPLSQESLTVLLWFLLHVQLRLFHSIDGRLVLADQLLLHALDGKLEKLVLALGF